MKKILILSLLLLFIFVVISPVYADPPQFSSFIPPDGTIDVPLNQALSWTASDPDPTHTLTYDVYFGTSLPPSQVSTNQTNTYYQPGQLTSLTVYYWQVVARDNIGNETTGPILTFVTLNTPPQLSSFSPSDGSAGESQTPTLSWSGSDPDGDQITYDVYFGTSSPPPIVSYSQTGNTYFTGQLGSLTRYYWQVTARDVHGIETSGPVLSFTTMNRFPQITGFSPGQGLTGISLTPTLSWTATDADPDDTLVYDVYFGASSPPDLVSSDQTSTMYQPGRLAYSSRYYWNVIARDRHGAETAIGIVYFNTVNIDNAIDHSASSISRPQVATDNNGHVYAVWEDKRNGKSDIYLNYSSDNGTTWHTSDKRLDKDTAGSADSKSPQICSDNAGHVYVVWKDTRTGSPEVYFNYSSNYGVTWQNPDRNLGAMPFNSAPQFPQIACDNNGHVYVAWNDNYFNTSSDNGATWLLQAMRISTAGGEDTQLTCDQNNRVYVAWRLGTTNVLFNYSLDDGSTWQSADRIVSGSGAIPSGGLSLTSDEGGRIYCAWHDTRNNANSPDVYSNSSSDGGSTWGASDIILNSGTPGSTNSTWPETACDDSGNVYVTWNDERNVLEFGDIYLNYSNDSGVNWQPQDTRLDTDTSGAADSGYPELTVDGNGNVYVIWSDDQIGIGSGTYLNHSLDNGATWLPTNRKVGSIGNDMQIVSDGSRLYIVRENNDVIFTKLAPFVPSYPLPQNGAAQVDVITTMSWRGGDFELDDTLTYDVYFDTSSPPTTLVSQNQGGTTYTPATLNYLSTYYWKVVSRNSNGNITSGPVWSFTTMSGPPQFESFSPPNGAINVGIDDDLSWTATDPDPGDTLVYDVYFGTTNPPARIASNRTSSIYNPGRLRSYTVYYWKVVAKDNHGSETASSILSFTTINHLPQFQTGTFYPPDGAPDVSLGPPDNRLDIPMRWGAVDNDGDPIRYDIYFGTSPDPPLVLSDQAITSYQPTQLIHMTVYYWKIVARDNHLAETVSPVMSFTTFDNPPFFSGFLPPSSATAVSLTPTLSWTATDPDPDDTLTYDIYFGTARNVAGIGVAVPDIDPVASIDFGLVSPGNYSDVIRRITNTGTEPLTINSVTFASGGSEFTYQGPATPFTVLPAGGYQDITIRFSPLTADARNDVVHISTNDPDELDVTFDVSGNGAPVAILRQPVAPVDFSFINVGTYLDRKTTIFNDSTVPLTITSITSGHADFAYQSPSIPFTIPAGLSQDITVRFSPVVAGTKSGLLHVYSNDPQNPHVTFTVSGIGAQVRNIGPVNSIRFNYVNVGGYLERKTTIWNTGTLILTINSITSESTDFTYQGPATPFNIPAGFSQEITVRFSPATAGPKSSVLHILSNDPDEPDARFSVSGNGAPVADIGHIASIDFGSVNVGSYFDGTTTIHNNSQTEPLTIDNIVVTSGGAEFTYKGQATPFIIPAGGSQVITVRFAPASAGIKSGVFHVYSNDPDEPDVMFDAPLVVADQTAASYQPGQLSYSTRYYWKVVARDNHGAEKSMQVVYFNTVSPPSLPPEFDMNGFLPADGKTNLKLDPTLSWIASDPDIGDTLTFDIYLGTTSPPPLYVSNHGTNAYKLTMLLRSTTYYWKIVARDSSGIEAIGPILSFTTGNPPVIEFVDPNPCQPLEVITIVGENFGETIGTSKIYLGDKVFKAGNTKIKSWSNTLIELKIPAYETMPSGKVKIKDLKVKVNDLYSDVWQLRIYKP